MEFVHTKGSKVDLTKIKPGYLFATPPSSWWQRWICKILGASTWHWGCFISPDSKGWIITESINKGVALTRCDYPKIRVYKIKGLEVTPKRLIGLVADYGAYPYDYDVYLKTAIWFLLKHYLGKLLPRHHDKEFHCQEWVCLLAYELGHPIINQGEYPMPQSLENSDKLDLVYGDF